MPVAPTSSSAPKSRKDLQDLYNRAQKKDVQATYELKSYLKKTVDPKLNVSGGLDDQTQKDFAVALRSALNQDAFEPASKPAAAMRSRASAGLSGGSGFNLDSAAGASGFGAAGVSSATVSMSGSVSDWIDQALLAMGIDPNSPQGQAMKKSLAIIIQHESGGNPNAVNNTDSNAAAGHSSRGLMQTIPSTFAANMLPGHSNILNPVDNIIAGARYAMKRYGSLDNVPGVVSVNRGGAYAGY